MNKYRDFTSRSKKFNLSEASLRISPRLHGGHLKLPNLYPSSSDISMSPEPLMTPKHFLVSNDSLVGISPLSHYQNLEYKKLSLDFPQKDVKSSLSNTTPPQLKDFSSILLQIDQVVSPKAKNQFFILNEDEPLLQTQPPGLPSYFKAYTKGKKPPLSVKISKYIGRPTVYSSFTESHPRPQCFDKVYYKNVFDISDRAFEFKADNVYLGVFCETECKYKIEISFGKHISLNEIRKAKFSVDKLQDEDKERIAERERLKKMKKIRDKNYDKNFVEANKDVRGVVESMKSRELMPEDWLVKRNEIVLRKKLLLIEKKNRAIDSLNRQARRIEKEEQKKMETMKEEAFDKFQKFFLTFIYLIKSADVIRGRITFKRTSILKRITVNLKASKIQKYVKSKFAYPVNMRSCILALNSFKFFRFTSIDMVRTKVDKILMKTIVRKANNNLLVHQIGNFGVKILKIQRAFQRYLNRRKKRLRRINENINVSIDKFFFSAKKKKNKKSNPIKVSVIPTTARNRILCEFYLSCVGKFYENLRNFNESKPDGSLFATAVEYPLFKYIPSDEALNELVSKILK